MYNKISKYDPWGVPTVTSAHRIGILGYRRGTGTEHYIAVQYCTNDDGTFKEYKACNLLNDYPLDPGVTLSSWLLSKNTKQNI